MLRRTVEMIALAAAFSGTILLAQALSDEDSLPRRLLREWGEAIKDRQAFVRTVRATIEQLPTRKGEQ